MQVLFLLNQVIIAGAPDAAETQALMAAAHSVFAPDRVVLPIDPSNAASKAWLQKHNQEALAMIEGATKEVRTSRIVVTSSWVCEGMNLITAVSSIRFVACVAVSFELVRRSLCLSMLLNVTLQNLVWHMQHKMIFWMQLCVYVFNTCC